MRAKGTWVFLFFVIGAAILAVVLNHALRDIFSWWQINNIAILGESFRLSTLLAGSVALVLALFFGVFYGRSREVY